MAFNLPKADQSCRFGLHWSARSVYDEQDRFMAENIIAPLSGKVTSVGIEIGQAVEEDDDAIVIEAMKMETSIYVPCDGVIKEIKAKVGDEVEKDDVLAVVA